MTAPTRRRNSASLTLVVILGLTFAACSNSPTEPRLISPEDIAGEWSWVLATGGIAGTTITPESEGFTLQLIISENGSIQILRSGTLETSTEYSIGPATQGEPSLAPGTLSYDVPLLGVESHAISVSGDELSLIEEFPDGFTYFWVRLEP